MKPEAHGIAMLTGTARPAFARRCTLSDSDSRPRARTPRRSVVVLASRCDAHRVQPLIPPLLVVPVPLGSVFVDLAALAVESHRPALLAHIHLELARSAAALPAIVAVA